MASENPMEVGGFQLQHFWLLATALSITEASGSEGHAGCERCWCNSAPFGVRRVRDPGMRKIAWEMQAVLSAA
jgi:hypothetical protein